MNVLGIDIGTKNIKIVHAESGKNLRIKNVYIIGTPEDAVADGEIKDMLLLAQRVKSFLKEKNIKAKEMRISLQSPNAVTRELKLPVLKKNEIMPAVEFELSQTFPGIVQSHTISYQQYSKQGEPIEGMSVFCPTKILDGYVEFANQVGVPLSSIDVSANCVTRAFKAYGDPANSMENIMLVDIGTTSSQVTVLSKGRLSMSRQVGTGALYIDQLVASRIGITIEQAERARTYNSFEKYDIQSEDMKTFVRLGYSSVEDQIRQTMEFFSYNKSKEPIKKIYLMGGGSNFPGLDAYLHETFNISVQQLKINIPGVKEPVKADIVMAAIGAILVEKDLTQQINLTPGLKILEKTRSQTNRSALLGILATIIAVASIGAYLYSYINVQSQNEKTQQLDLDMAKYSPVNTIKQEINLSQQSVDKMKAIVEKAEADSLINTALLTSIGKAMPEGVFISSYSTENGKTLNMAGTSIDRPGIADFLYKLKEITEIDLASLKSVGTRVGPDGLPTDYNFNISVQMKGR